MNSTEIKDLQIDEFIWVVFIFLSIINITGDECKKKYCINKKNKDSEEMAKMIFLFTLFISLIVYIYIAYVKYKRVKYNYLNNLDNSLALKRLFASILVIIASSIYLYCQIEEVNPSNPSIL